MRGKQAKYARRLVADSLPAGSIGDGISGRVSRGRVMRTLTKHKMKPNDSRSVKGQMVQRKPSVVLVPDTPRHVYQHTTKSWVKAKANYVS